MISWFTQVEGAGTNLGTKDRKILELWWHTGPKVNRDGTLNALASPMQGGTSLL